MKKTGGKYWEKQVWKFCDMFGFRLDESARVELDGSISSVFLVKAGRSTVSYKDKGRTWWRSGELQLSEPERNWRGCDKEAALRRLFAKASGKELIVRSSDKDRKTPYGFTKVRLIRHIKLPEFGSVEELKLKLAVKGE